MFKRHGGPTYHKTFKAARTAILGDLEGIRTRWVRLKAIDAVQAVGLLEQQANSLGTEGGAVEGVCDPHTRARYHAELVKRDV